MAKSGEFLKLAIFVVFYSDAIKTNLSSKINNDCELILALFYKIANIAQINPPPTKVHVCIQYYNEVLCLLTILTYQSYHPDHEVGEKRKPDEAHQERYNKPAVPSCLSAVWDSNEEHNLQR